MLFLVDLIDLIFDGLDDFRAFPPRSMSTMPATTSRLPFRRPRHGGRHADLDLGHIANVDGSAADLFDDDVLDILQCLDQTDAADDVFFGVLLENIAAGIGIVLGHGLEHVVERQIVFPQQARLDHAPDTV